MLGQGHLGTKHIFATNECSEAAQGITHCLLSRFSVGSGNYLVYLSECHPSQAKAVTAHLNESSTVYFVLTSFPDDIPLLNLIFNPYRLP